VSAITKSKNLAYLKSVTSSLVNPDIIEWRNSGKKVIGCMYHYIPEEIFTAAGMLSFRMRATGSKGTEMSEACLTQINCGFSRHLFDSGMRGDLSFLDGVVSANHCDHLRRFYENWQKFVKTPFMHFVVLPKKRGKEQTEMFRNELGDLIRDIEKTFGVSITEEKLRAAVKLHNETRRLQRELYNFRKLPHPPISGADVHAVMVAATSMPKEKYNSLLSSLLEELKTAEGISGYRSRLMVVGGEIDDPKIIEVIEGQGAIVVADSLGYGYRSIAKDIRTEGDILKNISDYEIMERPACPRLFGTTFERNAFVKKTADDFNVSGIISLRLPQCDEWSFEQVNLYKYMKKYAMPYLALDIDYVLSSEGQIKTRVQAFLETISGTKNVG